MKKILFLLLISVSALGQPYNSSGFVTITGQGTQTASGNNIVLAVAGTGSYDAVRFNMISIQIIVNGTVTSGAVTFEGSNDNTNFVTVPLFDELSPFGNPISTYNPLTGVNRHFNGTIHFRYFRARISTVIGGGGSLQAFTKFSDTSYQPDITPITNDDFNVTGAAAQTATVNNILTDPSGAAATDLSSFKSASIQVTSTGTGGTFIFEGSNDNTNFQAVPVWNQLILTGTPITAAITATASQIIYILPINFRFLRLRIVTTITGGSIRSFAKFSQSPFSPGIQQIAQSTAANLNVTAAGTVAVSGSTSLTPGTAAANLGKAEDNAHTSADVGVFTLGVQRSGPTLASQGAAGDYSEFAVDDGGAIWVRNRPLTYSRLVADGQVKATAGHLQSITFSPTGTPVAGVITIFDSATETGTVIFSVSIPASVFTPFTVTLDVAATTGIFVGFDGTVTNTQVTTTFR